MSGISSTSAMGDLGPGSGPGPAPVIELVDVAVGTLRDRTHLLLEGVNWAIRAGDFWSVGGLARSGKTNLMLVASGVLRPARGICRLFGRDCPAGYERGELGPRLKLGMVFDGGQLLQHLTLAENVALPLEYHAGDRMTDDELDARVAALVEFTGLAGWAGVRPGDVNRNWQQRYGLARALALKPEVLLLDSPLSGLDPRDAAWWLDTLDALASGHELVEGRPLTLVVTGDDLRPWRHRARQFAVVTDGAFVTLGGREEAERHPEPLLRDLLPPMGPGA